MCKKMSIDTLYGIWTLAHIIMERGQNLDNGVNAIQWKSSLSQRKLAEVDRTY